MKDLCIRPLKKEDFPAVEHLIYNTIISINSRDYPKDVIAAMLTLDPFRPRNTFQEREYFVYDDSGIEWIIGVKDNEIKTFFVDVAYHGKGIGTTLLNYATSILAEKGYMKSCVYSSISAKSFYEKHGYTLIREDHSDIQGFPMLRYFLEKKLFSDISDIKDSRV